MKTAIMNKYIFLDVPSLKTNIIAESRETSYEFCGLKCAENRFCVAVNYKKQAAWNESNCQLTNSTARKFGNLSSEKERVWTFIKVNVDRSQVVSKYYILFAKFVDKVVFNVGNVVKQNLWTMLFSRKKQTQKYSIGIKVSDVYRSSYLVTLHFARS
jgi:hypothetical protein